MQGRAFLKPSSMAAASRGTVSAAREAAPSSSALRLEPSSAPAAGEGAVEGHDVAGAPRLAREVGETRHLHTPPAPAPAHRTAAACRPQRGAACRLPPATKLCLAAALSCAGAIATREKVRLASGFRLSYRAGSHGGAGARALRYRLSDHTTCSESAMR